MPLLPNQVLNNRYQILALLGQGGMGSVYHAFDRTLNRHAAIKERLADPTATPTMLAQARTQFLREAQVLANLNHPNLPRVTDYFSFGASDFLVMDFVEGTNLQTLVQQHGAQSEATVLVWAKQLLDALEYIHARGVIHRDIKPQNVILTPDGRVMLVDFGLVKVLDPNNPYTATALRGMGTPGYAPIEQYATSTQHTDARTDLYALGATLYFVLTGHEPAEVHQRVINPAALATPRALNPGISARTESVILRAMEIQPQNRFASAAEMQQALAATATVPVSGSQTKTHYSPPPPPPPSTALLPVFAGIAGAVVLLVVVLAVALLARQPSSVALAPTSTLVASASPTAVPTSMTADSRPPTAVPTAIPTVTPVVIVVTATPIPTPTATATPQFPILSPQNADQIRELATLRGHRAYVLSVAFAPDGRMLASGSSDKTIKLWDVASGREVRTLSGHTASVLSVAFAPDGRMLASGSSDETIKLWDVASGREVRTLSGHTWGVDSVAFSPDGRMLASGSSDETIKLWDVASGREVRTLSGHTNYVYSVAFSPDGRLLASGSWQEIKLWDVASGREVQTLRGHTEFVFSVAFSPDGRMLASASTDGSVRLWGIR